MRIPLSWLKDFVEIPHTITVEALAERLTVAGLEVPKVHYIGIPQNADRHGVPPSDHLVWDRERILLGAIREVKPHPNADKLVLAVVDYGAGEPETVVTGAPNLLPYRDKGLIDPPLLTALALEGAELIDGHGDGVQHLILKEKELRGIPNRCMVCSEMELGISGEHEGILLLNYEDLKDIPAGTPLVDILGDAILEMELTPNLARCFSVYGVAREIAALYDLDLREPDYSLPAPSGDPNPVSIQIVEPMLNPRFTAALLRNVTIKESPWWMQWRLKLVGQRPISNVVDVTNYVMFEIGQPTHAFDYDLLAKRAGNEAPIIITRLPNAGETLTTLDGKTHQLDPSTLLVADMKGGLSLGGVMGGQESEVQDPDPSTGFAGTTTVLLEAAAWNFITIRKTINSTKVHSEAATRFSRGVHPEMAIRGLKRGIQLMCAVSGATLAPTIIDRYPNPAEVVQVEFPVEEAERLLGFPLSKAEITNLLERLQFIVAEAKDDPNTLLITVPDHRLDIATDVIGRADIAEELARVYGYNRIPNSLLQDALPPQRTNSALEWEERLGAILVKAGLREVINYRFTTPEHEALLTPSKQESSWEKRPYVEILNPISAERTALRQTLLASLLDNAVTNQYHHSRQALFEVGHVYYAKDEQLPDEIWHLGILLTGSRYATQWINDASAETENMDFYDLKGVIENLLESLHVPYRSISYSPSQHHSFHPGRVADLSINGEICGTFGQVHPLVAEAFGLGLDLQKPVLAAEIDLEKLLAHTLENYKVQAIPLQPPVYRDIAVVVDKTRLSADVENLIWQSGGDLLRGVRLFDVYEGQPIAEDQKSLAYALTFQSDHETLNDKAVNKIHREIVNFLEQHGAKLRA